MFQQQSSGDIVPEVVVTPLAVAASSFNRPSETFIRAHVDHILPGQTLAIDWPKPEDSTELPNRAAAHLRLDRPPRRLTSSLRKPFPAAEAARAVAFLRERGVRAVLAEFGGSAAQIATIALAAGARLYPHFHGVDASSLLRNPFVAWQYRRIFRLAEAIIAPSQFLIEKLVAIGCPREKTHVIPCGVDAGRFTPSEHTPGRVIMVGRLIDKKDPVTSIRAFAGVASRYPDAHLDVIGDGPLMEACGKVAQKSDAARQITLHGVLPHDKVKRLMGNASIFLQHSVTPRDGNTEGMPVALLEAMASGLGIVTTRHAGIPEAITDGTEGLLVDERDEAAMSRAIAALLSDPGRIERLGQAARSRFLAEFTQEITNGKLRRLMFPA